MNQPTHKHYQIAFQYVKGSRFERHQAPYGKAFQLRNNLELAVRHEPLPQPEHHKVEVEARIRCVDAEGKSVFEVWTCVEGIALASAGLGEEGVKTVLTSEVAASLFGTVRTQLTALTQGTGFAPVVLPPLSASKLSLLPQHLD